MQQHIYNPALVNKMLHIYHLAMQLLMTINSCIWSQLVFSIVHV